MSKKQEKCLVEACDSPEEVAGYCKPCYQGVWRMGKMGPAWVAKRVKAIKRLDSRYSLFTPRGRK